jgi:hypothetical protein
LVGTGWGRGLRTGFPFAKQALRRRIEVDAQPLRSSRLYNHLEIVRLALRLARFLRGARGSSRAWLRAERPAVQLADRAVHSGHALPQRLLLRQITPVVVIRFTSCGGRRGFPSLLLIVRMRFDSVGPSAPAAPTAPPAGPCGFIVGWPKLRLAAVKGLQRHMARPRRPVDIAARHDDDSIIVVILIVDVAFTADDKRRRRPLIPAQVAAAPPRGPPAIRFCLTSAARRRRA